MAVLKLVAALRVQPLAQDVQKQGLPAAKRIWLSSNASRMPSKPSALVAGRM